ncbi:MAG: hypothetical protein WC549_04650 [Actinomycetota bacterium]
MKDWKTQLSYSLPDRLVKGEKKRIKNNVESLLRQEREEIIKVIEKHLLEKEPLCERNALLTLIIEKIKNL